MHACATRQPLKLSRDPAGGGTALSGAWLLPARVWIPPALPGREPRRRGRVFSGWILVCVGIAATPRPNPEHSSSRLAGSNPLSTTPLPQTLSAAPPTGASQSPPPRSQNYFHRKKIPRNLKLSDLAVSHQL